MSRILCWFSAGASSAVATKLTLASHDPAYVVVAYADLGKSEHEDNQRFIADCESWFDHEVIRLRSEKYADIWQVFEERRFLVSPAGALCTTELKKKVRQAFEQPDDIQVFGYTVDKRDSDRAQRFRDQNPEVNLVTPLIERGLTKADCLGLLERVGIQLPAMYLLGFTNNNCIGCVKGGMGYWNKIRRDFPEVFARMAALEQEIGATVLREPDPNDPSKKIPLSLLGLDPERGTYSDEPNIECSLMCSAAEGDVA